MVVLRGKNGSGGRNSGTWDEDTQDAGLGEVGDVQKTMENVGVRLGSHVSSVSGGLGVPCVGLLAI